MAICRNQLDRSRHLLDRPKPCPTSAFEQLAEKLLHLRQQLLWRIGLAHQRMVPMLGRYRRRRLTCEEDVGNAFGVQILRYRENQFAAEFYVQQGEVDLMAC